ATAAGNRVRNDLKRLVQQRHRLAEVDDVDVVACAKDVRVHLWVPAVGLVAEVNAGFQKLAHVEIWQCHSLYPFRLNLREPQATKVATGGVREISLRRKP